MKKKTSNGSQQRRTKWKIKKGLEANPPQCTQWALPDKFLLWEKYCIGFLNNICFRKLCLIKLSKFPGINKRRQDKTPSKASTLNIPAFCQAILSNVPPRRLIWSNPRDVTPQHTGFLFKAKKLLHPWSFCQTWKHLQNLVF